MIEIITFLTIITMTLLTTRIAAVALVLTGMSDTSAKFQARSALSGVGYTTSEAENIMNNPIRRNIVMKLMLIGNIGFVTLISTGLLSATHLSKNYSDIPSISVFVIGLATLLYLALSKRVEKYLRKIIKTFFKKHTTMNVKDYESLISLSGNFILAEILIEQDGWLANKTLEDAKLDLEGVLVLGIKKVSGEYIGIPQGDTIFNIGDNATLYGHSEQLDRINSRVKGTKGEASHKVGIKSTKEMIANSH